MNSFGRLFCVTLSGASHGPAVVVTVEGMPAGYALRAADFGPILARRAGHGGFTTSRCEREEVEILSGVCRGYTTGMPITLVVRNGAQDSGSYAMQAELPRPGHADWVQECLFGGYADLRGGGVSSGRMTVGLVLGGYLAMRLLAPIAVHARVVSLGGHEGVDSRLLAAAQAAQDSLGGVVEVEATGVPLGLGGPFFDAVESLLAHLYMAIPGAKGVEFGNGFAASGLRGSENNDCYADQGGHTLTNRAGGFSGGYTNGMPLVARVAFKPTPSIGRAQQSLNMRTGGMAAVRTEGRHDVAFVLRTPPVVESCTALVLADLYLRRRARKKP